MVVVRVDVTGREAEARKRVVRQVIDYRDLRTGFTAMSRAVGFTASLGVQMIGRRGSTQNALLSPVNDISYQTIVEELARRNIYVATEVVDSA